ncbi:hypothetical protein TNCV_1241221 [Trichonephila clavipes]|uniref:Uncharacterized protein n=1 Tax=Trichonephila clavipes TaxID=2585209 RepID=A0A8X7BK29_TRICX|nr:hypothetical protein TNCV_1241221 [Trichonephila clavipes]
MATPTSLAGSQHLKNIRSSPYPGKAHLPLLGGGSLPMPRSRHKASFDQVSEFDPGRLVAYRDYGLSFREIGASITHGRKKATVKWISHR